MLRLGQPFSLSLGLLARSWTGCLCRTYLLMTSWCVSSFAYSRFQLRFLLSLALILIRIDFHCIFSLEESLDRARAVLFFRFLLANVRILLLV